MSKLTFLLKFFLLASHLNPSVAYDGINLPINGASDSNDVIDEDMPLDERDLPRELLDSLRDDEIIEEIIVKVDNRRQALQLKDKYSDHNNDFELGTRSGALKPLIIPKDPSSPRRGKINAINAEKTRGSLLANDLSREELIELLDNIESLEKAVPANRQLFSVKQLNKLSRLSDIDKTIVIDESKLPGKPQVDGSRCVEKVTLVEETEYERGMKCQHTLKKKCHTTYITDYHSAPEKKCETSFKKNCHISFKQVPRSEKVKKCYTPFVKVCGDTISGPEICTTLYENHCETIFKTYELNQDIPDCKMVDELRCNRVPLNILHLPSQEGVFATKERCEKWPVQKCTLQNKKVTKVHPQTQCRKVPRKVCTPSNCETQPGQEICQEEKRTQIQPVPEENCDLEPEESCRTESALIPRLVPNNNCVQVPKEICINTKFNPTKVKKPIVKNWCYDPEDLKKSILNI